MDVGIFFVASLLWKQCFCTVCSNSFRGFIFLDVESIAVTGPWDIPNGWRQMTLAEALLLDSELVAQLTGWDIISLVGGVINGQLSRMNGFPAFIARVNYSTVGNIYIVRGVCFSFNVGHL